MSLNVQFTLENETTSEKKNSVKTNLKIKKKKKILPNKKQYLKY